MGNQFQTAKYKISSTEIVSETQNGNNFYKPMHSVALQREDQCSKFTSMAESTIAICNVKWPLCASSMVVTVTSREYRVARAYADARVQRIYAGTNEIMKMIAHKC